MGWQAQCRQLKQLKLLKLNKLIVKKQLLTLVTLKAPSQFILSPSGLPDGKFYPGQSAELHEEDFGVSGTVRMNNFGSSRNLVRLMCSADKHCTPKQTGMCQMLSIGIKP